MTATAYEKVHVHADAFNTVREFLNERERRLFLAETAKEFGYGAAMILRACLVSLLKESTLSATISL